MQMGMGVLNGDRKFQPMDGDLIKILKESGLVKKPEEMLRDGWGDPFVISVEKGEIVIRSPHWK